MKFPPATHRLARQATAKPVAYSPITSNSSRNAWTVDGARNELGQIGFRAEVVASLFYSLICVVLDVTVTSRRDQAELQAEALALRRHVQALERQVQRVRWSPADRMTLVALYECLPRSARAGLLVNPEALLGWHRALVRLGSGRPIEVGPGAADRRSQKMSASSSPGGLVRIQPGVTSGCVVSC